jgi:cytochrome c-type biogenesis protein CcmH/NrfG
MQRNEVGPSVASKRRALLVVVAVTAFAAACSQVGELQARKAFKDANQKYQTGDYKAAAELYEETIKANPGESRAYFYLGRYRISSRRRRKASRPTTSS